MQLGTRWAMGAEPPSRLSQEIIDAVRRVESNSTHISPERRWTLTWLEGHPIVELDPREGSDEFTTIRGKPAGITVTIASDGSGEEGVEDEL